MFCARDCAKPDFSIIASLYPVPLPSKLCTAFRVSHLPCLICCLTLKQALLSQLVSKLCVQGSTFLKPSNRPFLPPQPSSLHSRRPHKTRVNAVGAAPVPPPYSGPASSFNRWLAQPHSTELTRFLEVKFFRNIQHFMRLKCQDAPSPCWQRTSST